MSLHYLVKLEMLIRHVLPLSCYRNKLQNFSTLTVVSKFAIFKSSWLQRMRTINAREGVQNTRHWYVRTETATENGVGQLGLKLGYVVSAEAMIRQWSRDSSRSVKCVLYTFSCNISHMLLSTGFKSGEPQIWRPQLRWVKFWSFCITTQQ